MVKLNLLPPEVKSEISYAKKNAKLYQYLIKSIAGLVTLLVVLGVVGFIVWNNNNIANQEKAIAMKDLSNWADTEGQAKNFAERLTLVEKLSTERLNWTKIFSEIANSTPANVTLTNLDFTNAEKERVSLSGMALSNTDISTFRELLSKSKLFQYVDIESINTGSDPITSKTVLNFKITLNLNVAEAKKQ